MKYEQMEESANHANLRETPGITDELRNGNSEGAAMSQTS